MRFPIAVIHLCMALQLVFFFTVGYTWQQQAEQRQIQEKISILLSLPISALGEIRVSKI